MRSLSALGGVGALLAMNNGNTGLLDGLLWLGDLPYWIVVIGIILISLVRRVGWCVLMRPGQKIFTQDYLFDTVFYSGLAIAGPWLLFS